MMIACTIVHAIRQSISKTCNSHEYTGPRHEHACIRTCPYLLKNVSACARSRVTPRRRHSSWNCSVLNTSFAEQLRFLRMSANSFISTVFGTTCTDDRLLTTALIACKRSFLLQASLPRQVTIVPAQVEADLFHTEQTAYLMILPVGWRFDVLHCLLMSNWMLMYS